MEFSGQYLTYEDYKELGGTFDLMPFNLLEFEARKKIDIKTFGRLKNINYNDLPQEVKICEYNLINTISSYINTTNKNITSENTDGYSVSYVSPTQINEVIISKNNELDDIITTSLFGVIVNNEHLIYTGV